MEKALAVVAALVVVGGVRALESWLVMLLAGGLHNSVHEGVPAVGFGAAVVVTLALNLIGGFFKR